MAFSYVISNPLYVSLNQVNNFSWGSPCQSVLITTSQSSTVGCHKTLGQLVQNEVGLISVRLKFNVSDIACIMQMQMHMCEDSTIFVTDKENTRQGKEIQCDCDACFSVFDGHDIGNDALLHLLHTNPTIENKFNPIANHNPKGFH